MARERGSAPERARGAAPGGDDIGGVSLEAPKLTRTSALEPVWDWELGPISPSIPPCRTPSVFHYKTMHCASLFEVCRRPAFFAGLLATAFSASAQLPQPKLFTVFPPGARSGTSVDVAVTGAELDELQLRFNHPGITTKALAAANGRAVPGHGVSGQRTPRLPPGPLREGHLSVSESSRSPHGPPTADD